MNLNDGDTLRAIMALEQWVRDSHEVRFALQVFMALNSNNFVKFFKLVSAKSVFVCFVYHRSQIISFFFFFTLGPPVQSSPGLHPAAIFLPGPQARRRGHGQGLLSNQQERRLIQSEQVRGKK